jgi:AmiR/NasT family two-component response regulator
MSGIWVKPAVFAFVIDNDIRVRQALCDELRRRLVLGGVDGTGSGPHVTERLQELKPDLLFLDLSAAGQIEIQLRSAPPPAIVFLSADDHAMIRELHSLGLTAWTKPEVFDELDAILRWAERLRSNPDRLWDEWTQAASRIGTRHPADGSKVVAFDGNSEVLIDAGEVLAAKSVGRMTELALTDRIVLSPYPISFLKAQLHARGLGRRLLIDARKPWRSLLPVLRLLWRAPPPRKLKDRPNLT